MSQVSSTYIWYPNGYPGSAYDLRAISMWWDGPGPGQVTARFGDTDTAPTIIFNKAAFEAAMNGAEVPPSNTVPPVVSGAGYVGKTLTGTNGSWSGVPSPTFTYQWQRFTGSWTDIPLATAITYVVPLADEGVPLRLQVTATNLEGSAVAVSNTIEQWVPTDLGAALAAWYDSYAPATITLVGSAVSQWFDRSGNGRHIVQGTGADQPIYNATSLNGTPGLTASNQGDNLAASSLWSPEPVVLSVIGSVIRGVQNADPGSSYRFFVSTPFGGGITGVRCVWAPRASTGPAPIDSIRAGVLSTNTTDHSIAANTVNTPTILSATLPGDVGYTADDRIYLDGVVGSTPGGLPAASGSATRFTVFGDNTSGARSVNGTIGDLIVTNTIVGTTDRQKGEGYVAWRRNLVANLPIGHPYKTVPPTP